MVRADEPQGIVLVTETANRYNDYFQSIFNSHGGLPPGDFNSLLTTQLEAIRAQLVEHNFDSAAIEDEMRLATAAATRARAARAGVRSTTPSQAAEPQAAAPRFAMTVEAARTAFAKHPLAILAALLLICYVTVLTMFLREGQPSMVITGVAAQATPIEAHFIALDLVRETATMTLTPMLSSPLVAERGKLLGDVQVEIDTGTTVLTHTFKGGDTPVPWIAVIPIEYGDQFEYPFDRHGGDFHIKATRKGEPGTVANLKLDKITHGFKLVATGEPAASNAELNVEFEITRSASVIFLAMIAMASLSLVVVSALNVAWQVAMRDRKVEFSMMVWIAALLFVVPSVRNGLPGGPPPGALVDIALFFWLHVLTVAALLTVVWNWSHQK